ncbi:MULTISPECIES: NCS2 family permease [Gordonia]|uniref:NCS2 family permease n=2 Tax=Gordonia TaxID=2053 RepID=A0ABN3H201_9ACTN|nr:MULTISPECIES: NCS2 family permease [Gordonia]AUH69884.1 NCS2 family permease [Gordonia sp. YC-JH1]KJR06177.1 MFS transporter [Gordonia sihwensis]KXT57064.1 MFS transporter [Gordonia sp. QH-12]MBY4570513.1 MFS transporter [Gordonia sihwensis]WFN93509.1 NCS2 family permease [Gordonia sihwensis]
MTDPADNEPQEANGTDTAKTSQSVLDRYFKIRERGSTVAREVRGGLVTFFTMAYIVVLTPIIIGGVPGKPINADSLGNVLPMLQVAAVVALAAGVMSIVFGLVANYPFGLAAGIGISSLLAVTIAPQMSWPAAMGLVVIDGVIIVLLGLTGVRTAVFNAVPAELKSAIAAGIGAFIAFIGFINAGFVTRPEAAGAPPVQLGHDGSIGTVPTVVFVVGVLLMAVLVVRKVPGGLLLGIIVMTVVSIIVEAVMHLGPASEGHGGWAMNVPKLPSGIGGLPDLSLVGDVDLFGAFTGQFDDVSVLIACVFLFTLLLSNFFDAMGTMTGLGKEGGLADKDGNLPGIGRALMIEGTGAIVGGASSASSNTVLVESSAGIAEGARTGFANIVTGVLFLAAMFFTPLYSVVPMEAVAPVLVVVGAMMMGQIRDIDFTRFELALPAFLTIVTMPFTYSIANGIGVGFISWVVLGAARGQWRRMHPLLYVVAVLFLLYFARGPISDLISG